MDKSATSRSPNHVAHETYETHRMRARVLSQEYLDRSSERSEEEDREPGPVTAVRRRRSDLGVGTGPRDRQSKYWDTGTLSPSSMLPKRNEEKRKGESWSREKESKIEIKQRRVRLCLNVPKYSSLRLFAFPLFFILTISLPKKHVFIYHRNRSKQRVTQHVFRFIISAPFFSFRPPTVIFSPLSSSSTSLLESEPLES